MTDHAQHAEASVLMQTIRELHELITALDRRVPQLQRVQEISIAQTAARLKAAALQRIEELESKTRRTSALLSGEQNR